MDWERKVEMVELLNNGKYEEAVALFGNEREWDDQAVDMFVTGFDLTQCHLLRPIKERINAVTTSNYRIALRLAAIEVNLGEE